jgi:hypothetical protein
MRYFRARSTPSAENSRRMEALMPERKSDAEATEAAAIRRRWITFGEVLAVAAVLISGLTFWNSYQERNSAEAERVAQKQGERAKAQTLTLKAEPSGSTLELSPLDPEQAIQSQTVAFPSPLEVAAAETVDPRIEAGWIERAAKKAKKANDGKRAGDARLPVAITTRFVRGGSTYTDAAIYDVGYRLESGLLDTDARLLGLSLVERSRPERLQARLDAIWQSRTK